MSASYVNFPGRVSQVLDKDFRVLFEGRTVKIDAYLRKNPSREKRWIKLRLTGRIISEDEYRKE